MKCQIAFFIFVASSVVYAKGEIEGNIPIDPSTRPINGVLRVVPVTGDGSHQTHYCRHGANGTLTIRLVNIGKSPTPPQNVEVTFYTRASVVVRRMASRVNGGARTDISVPMREFCSNPGDCAFSIKLVNQDPVAGLCIG
jgi:hypothetical protein